MANTYSFADPVAITKATANNLGLEMIDLRRGLSGLSQPMYGGTVGALTGVFPDGTASAGLPNPLWASYSGLTVTFNGGNYAVDRGGGNLYLGMAYAGWSMTLDVGDAINPRIDTVVIRHRDPGLAGEENATQSAWPVILKGTPAASPSKPTAQITAADVPLMSFTVGGGGNANTILASSDERLFITARGGIYPRGSQDSRPGAYEGHYRDNQVTGALERWDGNAWTVIASAMEWTPFTPGLWSSAGAVNLGSGGQAAGRYQVIGKLLRVRYAWDANTGCNFGYGPIYTRLPAGLIAASQLGDHHGRAQLNTETGGYRQWLGDAGLWSGTNQVFLWFPKSQSDVTTAQYQVASSQGQAGTGIPYIANGFPDPLRGLTAQLDVEIQ